MSNRRLCDELAGKLATLPQDDLMTLVINSLVRHYPTPSRACSGLVDLLGSLSGVMNEAAQLDLIDRLRNVADLLEQPILRARHERSLN